MDINKLLTDSLSRAKWQEELKRMEKADEALDFYNYEQIEYTNKLIESQFPKSYTDMVKYTRTYPITEQIINDISLLAKKPIKFILPKEIQSDETKTALFTAEIIDKPMINAFMLMINRYVNLLDKIAVMPLWYKNGNHIELDIITPDKCFVIQDPDSPSHILAFVYRVNSLENTPTTALPTDIWMMVTPEYTQKITIDSNSGQYKFAGEQEPNPYKVIPVAWFTNTISVKNFWPEKGNPYVAINKDFNVLKTLQRLAETYQMYSTLVRIGFPSESVTTWGVASVIDIPLREGPGNQGDAKYISPDTKFKEVDDLMNGDVDNLAAYAGLSNDVFRKKTQTLPSGYALKLSKADVIEQNETEKLFYVPAIRQLLNLMIQIFSYHSPTQTLESIKSDLINIDFQPISIEQNPIEQAQLRVTNKMLGIADRVTWLMEDNPELTEEEALEFIAKIDARNQTYNLDTDLTDATNATV